MAYGLAFNIILVRSDLFNIVQKIMVDALTSWNKDSVCVGGEGAK